MLYDPKWEKQTETKVNPLSLNGLLAWLEKQPADAEYNWSSIHGCLVCNYLRAVTGETHPAMRWDFGNVIGEHYATIASPRPWTNGAALDRARAALANH